MSFSSSESPNRKDPSVPSASGRSGASRSSAAADPSSELSKSKSTSLRQYASVASARRGSETPVFLGAERAASRAASRASRGVATRTAPGACVRNAWITPEGTPCMTHSPRAANARARSPPGANDARSASVETSGNTPAPGAIHFRFNDPSDPASGSVASTHGSRASDAYRGGRITDQGSGTTVSSTPGNNA